MAPQKTKGRASRDSNKEKDGENEDPLVEQLMQELIDSEVKQANEGEIDEMKDLAESEGQSSSTTESRITKAIQKASEVFPPEVNCVFAFLHLHIKLDLVHICTRVRGAEYNPKRFHAVVLRIREPKATAIMYASGKLVCMGAKNEKSANIACRKFVRILQKIGYKDAKFNPTDEEPLIRNIMAKVKVPFPIRLEDLAIAHRDFVSYEPEIFPGLIYRMASPRVTVFVFVTGTILVVGAKSRADVYSAFDAIYPVLYEYKKQDQPLMPNTTETGSRSQAKNQNTQLQHTNSSHTNSHKFTNNSNNEQDEGYEDDDDAGDQDLEGDGGDEGYEDLSEDLDDDIEAELGNIAN
eukprot:CAMPEP_0197532162 /NCGR_PEP_ID=MMETSP1318-20131121/38730_1 /TAXON_ID=552666 /ORGANISM="Partenskyella glossopodia, Strain RCC365" /LENGTH=350 /DNA_ID=CAMNT_0043088637 /DNA_START=15 /DNA_END=1067 /DNA_ORIENTATION=-